jgi:hypothetical protein
MAVVSARILAPVPEVELRAIASRLCSQELTMVLACVRSGYQPEPVRNLAQKFQVDRRTLNNRLLRMGLPSASLLARCGRLFHECELERRGIRSRIEIARRLGFDTTTALRMFRMRVLRALRHDEDRGVLMLSLLGTHSRDRARHR